MPCGGENAGVDLRIFGKYFGSYRDPKFPGTAWNLLQAAISSGQGAESLAAYVCLHAQQVQREHLVVATSLQAEPQASLLSLDGLMSEARGPIKETKNPGLTEAVATILLRKFLA